MPPSEPHQTDSLPRRSYRPFPHRAARRRAEISPRMKRPPDLVNVQITNTASRDYGGYLEGTLISLPKRSSNGVLPFTIGHVAAERVPEISGDLCRTFRLCRHSSAGAACRSGSANVITELAVPFCLASRWSALCTARSSSAPPWEARSRRRHRARLWLKNSRRYAMLVLHVKLPSASISARPRRLSGSDARMCASRLMLAREAGAGATKGKPRTAISAER